MMAFDAETADGALKVVLFARGLDQAFELFCEHHVRARGTMPGACSIVRRTLRDEENHQALRDALGRDEVGLGVLRGGRWNIVPLIAPG